MTAILEPIPAVEGRAADWYCGAKKRQAEGSCGNRAGFGTNHVGLGRCKLHGGSTHDQRKAVEGVVIEARARQLFGLTEDIKPVENPLAVYADFAGRVVGWMKTLDQLVHQLDSPRYAAMTGEQIRGEVQLFERAMDRCNSVLSTYAKLGIDERLARISEAQSFMVMQAIEAALAAAGVTGSRAIEAKKAAAKRLRVVEAAVVKGTATTP